VVGIYEKKDKIYILYNTDWLYSIFLGNNLFNIFNSKLCVEQFSYEEHTHLIKKGRL